MRHCRGGIGNRFFNFRTKPNIIAFGFGITSTKSVHNSYFSPSGHIPVKPYLPLLKK